jgi:hypothetical protein
VCRVGKGACSTLDTWAKSHRYRVYPISAFNFPKSAKADLGALCPRAPAGAILPTLRATRYELHSHPKRGERTRVLTHPRAMNVRARTGAYPTSVLPGSRGCGRGVPAISPKAARFGPCSARTSLLAPRRICDVVVRHALPEPHQRSMRQATWRWPPLSRRYEIIVLNRSRSYSGVILYLIGFRLRGGFSPATRARTRSHIRSCVVWVWSSTLSSSSAVLVS